MKLRKLIVIIISVILVVLACGYYGWYKPGADRAQCILNIRDAHQVLRAYEGMTNKWQSGEIIDYTEAHRYLDRDTDFKCPSGGTYEWIERYSAPVGTPYLRCSHEDHKPTDTSGW